MKDILDLIEVVLSSNAALSVVCLIWVFVEMKTHLDDKKQHVKERYEWAEKIETLTEALNTTINFLSHRHSSY